MTEQRSEWHTVKRQRKHKNDMQYLVKWKDSEEKISVDRTDVSKFCRVSLSGFTETQKA